MVNLSMKIRFIGAQAKRLLRRNPIDIGLFIKYFFILKTSLLLQSLSRVIIKRYSIKNLHPKAQDTFLNYNDVLEKESDSIYGKKIFETGIITILNQDIEIRWPPVWENKHTGIWPKGKSKDIAYYGPGIEKDIKIIWELNRLQWMVNVAAYASKVGNKKIISEILDSIVDHAKKHPIDKTVAWIEGIEVSLRSISIIQSLRKIIGPTERDERLVQINTYLSQHARWLELHLSRKWRINNNHLIIELVGLAILGSTLSWHPNSKRWFKKGIIGLEYELNKQITEGRNWEPTTAYHRFVTEALIVLIELTNGHKIRDINTKFIAEICQEMLDTLVSMTSDSGHMPLIGDDDGGYVIERDLFNPTSNIEVFEFALNVGFKIIEKNDGIKIWSKQGMGVYRKQDILLHAVAGAPRGKSRQGSHRHLDMLSITATIGDKEVILDSGTGLYFGSKEWRDYFRGEEGHSGLRDKNHKWAKMEDLFEITKPPIGTLTIKNQVLLLSAEHPSGIYQTREIIIRNKQIELCDNLILNNPIVTFVLSNDMDTEIIEDKLIISDGFFKIVHTPIPMDITIKRRFNDPNKEESPSETCSTVSNGYGSYSTSCIVELHHKKGTIANTHIFKINS